MHQAFPVLNLQFIRKKPLCSVYSEAVMEQPWFIYNVNQANEERGRGENFKQFLVVLEVFLCNNNIKHRIPFWLSSLSPRPKSYIPATLRARCLILSSPTGVAHHLWLWKIMCMTVAWSYFPFQSKNWKIKVYNFDKYFFNDLKCCET